MQQLGVLLATAPTARRQPPPLAPPPSHHLTASSRSSSVSASRVSTRPSDSSSSASLGGAVMPAGRQQRVEAVSGGWAEGGGGGGRRQEVCFKRSAPAPPIRLVPRCRTCWRAAAGVRWALGLLFCDGPAERSLLFPHPTSRSGSWRARCTSDQRWQARFFGAGQVAAAAAVCARCATARRRSCLARAGRQREFTTSGSNATPSGNRKLVMAQQCQYKHQGRQSVKWSASVRLAPLPLGARRRGGASTSGAGPRCLGQVAPPQLVSTQHGVLDHRGGDLRRRGEHVPAGQARRSACMRLLFTRLEQVQHRPPNKLALKGSTCSDSPGITAFAAHAASSAPSPASTPICGGNGAAAWQRQHGCMDVCGCQRPKGMPPSQHTKPRPRLIIAPAPA